MTPEQQTLLDRRRAGFDLYLAERLPVLVDFCSQLELPDPYRVVNEAEVFLGPIDQWVARRDLHGEVDPTERIWVALPNIKQEDMRWKTVWLISLATVILLYPVIGVLAKLKAAGRFKLLRYF